MSVPTDKAKEKTFWKKIAFGSGDESNAIGREKIRECLYGVTMECLDPCWAVGFPTDATLIATKGSKRHKHVVVESCLYAIHVGMAMIQ